MNLDAVQVGPVVGEEESLPIFGIDSVMIEVSPAVLKIS